MNDKNNKSFLYKPAAALAAAFSLFLFLLAYRFIVLAFIDRFDAISRYPVESLVFLVGSSYKSGELLYLACFSAVASLFLTFLPERGRKAFYAFLITLSSFWVIYRTLNLFNVYYTKSNLQSGFIANINLTTAGMLLDYKAIALMATIASVVYVVYRLVRYLGFHDSTRNERVARFIVFATALVGLLGAADILSLSCSYGNTCSFALPDNEEQTLKLGTAYPILQKLPERELYSSLKGSASEIAYPSPELMGKMRQFGIFLDPQKRYPLSREHVYHEAFPYPRSSTYTDRPNIIIILVESLSTRLLNFYGNTYEDLTPNMDRIVRNSLVVAPTYNSAAFTTNGILSVLCSYYPSIGSRIWGAADDYFLCLPEILKQRGYNSYGIFFDSRVLKSKVMTDNVRMFKVDEITHKLHEGPKGSIPRLPSDRQVMRFMRASLEEGYLEEPFLLMASTLDFHPTYRLPGDGVKYEGEDNIILDLVASFDRAIGDFWEYFDTSPYSDNTIVVITADHAMWPSVKYTELFELDENVREYDTVPFILYDPTHDLPGRLDMLASQVDITPSLLHVLEFDTPNPFEGHSVFGEKGRAKYQNVLGSHSTRYFYRYNGENVTFYLGDSDCEKSEDGSNTRRDTFTPCDYLGWLKYKGFLIRNNRIWGKDIKKLKRNYE